MKLPLIAVPALAAGIMAAQAETQSSGPRPEFEVVSIKASPRIGSIALAIGTSATPGTVTLTGITPRSLIARAYSLKPYQISGPAWLEDERWDIVAKSGGPVSDSVQKLMLQSLLASRFRLAVHTETRVLPAYELVAGKGGPKIQEAAPDGGGGRVYPGRAGISAKQIPMARLAELLSAKIDSPVLDRTGMPGVFDIDLTWTPEAAPADTDPGPAISAALQEQLGLKLEAHKTPIEMLVVDHVERPAGN